MMYLFLFLLEFDTVLMLWQKLRAAKLQKIVVTANFIDR